MGPLLFTIYISFMIIVILNMVIAVIADACVVERACCFYRLPSATVASPSEWWAAARVKMYV